MNNSKTVTENRCPVCGAEQGYNHALGCAMGDINADSLYLIAKLEELINQGAPVESDV